MIGLGFHLRSDTINLQLECFVKNGRKSEIMNLLCFTSGQTPLIRWVDVLSIWFNLMTKMMISILLNLTYRDGDEN